jgi:hypothetical protein
MIEFLDKIEDLPLSAWIKESPVWGEPSILTLHTIGMMIVAGIATIIALRLLGVGRGLPVKPMERLFPFAWWGFTINAITGVLLLMAEASNKLTNPVFYFKLIFVFGGVALLVLTRKRVFRAPELDRGVMPGSAKSLAWLSLFCWFAAITAGRLLPYTGKFGPGQ